MPSNETTYETRVKMSRCVICARPHQGHMDGMQGPFCDGCYEGFTGGDCVPPPSLESRVDELEARLLKVEGQLFRSDPMPGMGS